MFQKRWLPVVLIVIMALAILLIRQVVDKNEDLPKVKKGTANASVNRNRGFDRRISYLNYSNHATCRMSCRGISREEVEMVMQEGQINYRKSDIKNARCPRYALEGNTGDGQRVRIIYAQCDETTTVVTVIDLGQDHPCNCPGDDEKYSNKR